MATQIGIWLPMFGGWLRNVDDERMDWTFEYNQRVAQLADRMGFSTILVAELNLNDIKGLDSPCIEAWTTISALAATTRQIRLMAAIRPGFRQPALVAKMAANIDHISNGRFELNLVSAWWKEEMEMYAGGWLDHNERYRRSREFVRVMKGAWTEPVFNFDGEFYTAKGCILSPKPVQKPWPPIYAGGESDEGRDMIAAECDAYLMHGDSLEVIQAYIVDMRARRERFGRPPLRFGMAAYIICRETEREARDELARVTNVQSSRKTYDSYQAFLAGTKMRTQISLEDYSVSNRGLRPGFVGTPEQIAERIHAYQALGLDLILAQCSPMHEDLDFIGRRLLPLLDGHKAVAAGAA